MRALFAVLLAFCLLIPARANDLPELGDASEAALSIGQERSIGYGIMRQIRATQSYLDDADVAEYLQRVGYRLVSVSPDTRMDFHFFALRDKSVNAFALPGGYIGVHAGLLLTAQTESELVAVLGHEIAHVTQRHIARMVAQQQRAGMTSLAAIAIAILAARSNPQAAAGAIAAAQAQALDSRLAFTRDNEREADRVGLQIVERSGYDPHAMPVFLDRLQRATRILDSSSVPSYLRTHPITYERIADVQNRTMNLPYKQVPDSLDFHLVRAKVRALTSEPRDAITFFDEQISDRKFNSEVGVRYGLVLSLLRAENVKRAATEMTSLRRIAPENAMITGLEARLRLAQKDREGAVKILADGVKAFPGSRSLGYDYAEALIGAGRTADALNALDDQLLKDQNDGKLYELQAKAYEAQGKTMLKHKSLAEAYLSAGNVQAAIEQLQQAQRASDGDFYENSSIEARLRELRAVVARQEK
jgi:predicted Zn-dependent protease